MRPQELRSPSAKSPPCGASRPEISSSGRLQDTGHLVHLEEQPHEAASLKGDSSHRHHGLVSQLKDTDRSAAGSRHSVLLGDTHLKDDDSGPGDSVRRKRQPLKMLSNPGKGPYRVLLTHPCADRSKGGNSRICTSHKKGTPHHKCTSTPLLPIPSQSRTVASTNRTSSRMSSCRHRGQTAVPRHGPRRPMHLRN